MEGPGGRSPALTMLFASGEMEGPGGRSPALTVLFASGIKIPAIGEGLWIKRIHYWALPTYRARTG